MVAIARLVNFTDIIEGCAFTTLMICCHMYANMDQLKGVKQCLVPRTTIRFCVFNIVLAPTALVRWHWHDGTGTGVKDDHMVRFKFAMDKT